LFDFNKVRVVGVTVSTIDEIPDSEGLLSYAARVSAPDNQENFDTAAKLLQYCVRHKHFSVFETCNIVIEIETPRDIARQILRHRSFSFQEFSQRYAKATNFTLRECRLQDKKNRQNSLDCFDEDTAHVWKVMQDEVLAVVEKNYQHALDIGIAKEVSRTILPEGLTMSKMYMNGTVRSWLHFISVRDDEGVAQKEIVDVARKAKEQILLYFPFLEEVMVDD